MQKKPVLLFSVAVAIAIDGVVVTEVPVASAVRAAVGGGQ